MAYTRQDKDGDALLKIHGPMSLYEVKPLQNELRACLEQYEKLILDLESMSDCDTAGVQLLCSARKTARGANKRMVVRGASGSVLEAVSLLGLNPEEVFDAREEVSNG